MPDLCPYSHQLCADRHLCTVTPAQMLTWHEQAKSTVPPKLGDQPDPSKPPTCRPMEATADSTRLARLDWVAFQMADCPQALPRLTPEKWAARVSEFQAHLPL